MPSFYSNYPGFQAGGATLLPTPARIGAYNEYTGRGVVIAFIDAGFSMHPDIADRVLVHVDASTRRVVEQPRVMEISDLSWHGQMTSVIACGDGTVSGGHFRGVAPGAELVLVRVATPRGQVKEADILRGLQWVNSTHRRFGIRVVNISVGGDDPSGDPNHPLHRAVHQLTDAGVTVVAAAGNSHTAYLLPPASAPTAISVGGYTDHNSAARDRWTAYHNNYGASYDGTPKPDVTALAEWVASPILPGSLVAREARWLAPLLNGHRDEALAELLERGYGELGIDRREAQAPDDALYTMLQGRINGYKLIDGHHQHVDGTSVSAAIASSVIAQMIEANPRLTPGAIKAILTTTATPLPHLPREKQGGGAIDAARAVEAAKDWRG